MSNGGKRVVLNTRERVISNDFNRVQDMVGQARAVLMARLYNDVYKTSISGYTDQEILGGQTPMIADVYGGLFVRVDDPSSLFVDPGVIGVVDPDPSPGLDDNPYKLVDDPGQSIAGVLTFLANGSPSARIDVLLADVQEQVEETDNRDVFDPATGLFTPQMVNKVVRKRLVYTMLRGTAGSGLPSLPNQVPLLVALVPSGAADFSDCTFWDVRPMVNERTPNHGYQRDTRRLYDFNFYVDSNGEHHGEAWTEWNGYVVGGPLKQSCPSTLDEDFDSSDINNSTTNLAYGGPASSPVRSDPGAAPIFLLFPGGLPGWRRYSNGNAPGLTNRAPYGTRGLLVAGRNTNSDKAKIDEKGNATNVVLPAATGLTGTANGVMLYMGHCDSEFGGASYLDVIAHGSTVEFPCEFDVSGIVARAQLSATAVAQDAVKAWDYGSLVRDSNDFGWPLNAVQVKVGWLPPDLTTATGVAPPNSSYNELGFWMGTDLVQMIPIGQQSGLDSGTTIPDPMTTPLVWLPIRFDPDNMPSVNINTGIARIDSAANPGLNSRYRFSAATTRLYLAGYQL